MSIFYGSRLDLTHQPDLSLFTHTEKLHLDRNDIRVLYRELFPPNVKEINISMNRLLSDGLIEHWNDLIEILNLSDNQILDTFFVASWPINLKELYQKNKFDKIIEICSILINYNKDFINKILKNISNNYDDSSFMLELIDGFEKNFEKYYNDEIIPTTNDHMKNIFTKLNIKHTSIYNKIIENINKFENKIDDDIERFTNTNRQFTITNTKETMDELGIVRNTDYYANKKSFSITPISGRSPMFSNSKDEISPKNNSATSRKSQKVFFATDPLKSSSDDNNNPKPNSTLLTNSQIDKRWYYCCYHY